WQTAFLSVKFIGWVCFYLSTILDDFSRYIIAWKLCTTMRADDVTDTLQMALTASGCWSGRVVHKPSLLSDNGSSYVSGDLAKWLEDASMDHVRGAPCPQARSSVGTRTSKTASCSKTTTYRATSKRTSVASSITTITGATTKACRTCHRPTSTSEAAKPSCFTAKGSNEKPSERDDCSTAKKPPKLKLQPSQSLPSRKPQTVVKHLTTDSPLTQFADATQTELLGWGL